MGIFNNKNRTSNAIKASSIGFLNQFIKLALNFGYRTVFLIVLSKEYLGLDGLFLNILHILQLAELGIGTAIIYRLYGPIKNGNIEKVAELVNFYKIIYRFIALIVTILGVSLIPFLDFFIKDTAEIPADINIYIIYGLFLLQTVSSYFFVYKQSILMADQKNHLVSLILIIINICKFSLQTVVLILTKNYVLTLAASIIVTILINFVVNIIINKQYKELFIKNAHLPKEEMKNILKDTGAILCHRIGGTVVFSTSSIILSAYIGIGVLGIYSNYSLIIVGITGFLTQIMSAFISSIGNLHLENDVNKKVDVYYKLLFANLWLSCFCTVSLYVLISPFIEIWQSSNMLLDKWTVMALCISFFITSARNITTSFITASGLFVKDKLRPIIEATINLAMSILLVKMIGLIGIFIATIISSLLTVWWREPYLLHKYELKYPLKKYYLYYFICILLTIIIAFVTNYICNYIPNTWSFIALKFVICLILPNLIIIMFVFWTKEFKYFVKLLLKLFSKIGNKFNKKLL